MSDGIINGQKANITPSVGRLYQGPVAKNNICTKSSVNLKVALSPFDKFPMIKVMLGLNATFSANVVLNNPAQVFFCVYRIISKCSRH